MSASASGEDGGAVAGTPQSSDPVSASGVVRVRVPGLKIRVAWLVVPPSRAGVRGVPAASPASQADAATATGNRSVAMMSNLFRGTLVGDAVARRAAHLELGRDFIGMPAWWQAAPAERSSLRKRKLHASLLDERLGKTRCQAREIRGMPSARNTRAAHSAVKAASRTCQPLTLPDVR
jgi:hypothetical protein